MILMVVLTDLGLLVCHSRETDRFDHIKLPYRDGIPIVHFDRVCEEINTSKVIQDDVVGAQAVVEHLLEQGCRRIGILAGPDVKTLVIQENLIIRSSSLQLIG